MAFLQDKKKIFTHGRKTEIAISEELEQIRFCDFLKLNRLIKFTHIANERVCSIAYRKKLKALGVSVGFPDLEIFLPNGKILFVEMKRKKAAKVSDAQKEWAEFLIDFAPFVKHKICYGAGEAIDFVKQELESGR